LEFTVFKLWRRYRRPLRLLVTTAALSYVAYLIVAWTLGVDFDGSGKMTAAPSTATRNFLQGFPAVVRSILPFLLQAAVIISIVILQFVGLFWYMSRGRTYTIYPGEYDVTFNDVRGQSHIVSATKEVMKLFQGYKHFKKVGGYPPHGILFEGPPGTGKTLLGKAIAGETGVPFMYASGAGFVNMFLGVSNLRVARMFKKARLHSEKYGGCVIFIDELDSIGGSRGGVSARRDVLERVVRPAKYVVPGYGGGGDSSLVNELLTQLDGIDQPKRLRRWVRRTLRRKPAKITRHNILVIGATNRAETLDPALLRPGRFDRKIHVGNPSEAGRKDIIAYYLNKVAHVPLDVDRVARATSGYSPARIKNIINEALIFALQDGRSALTYDDIWKAKLTDEIGLVEPVEYSEKDKAASAIHESGHAIAGHFLRPSFPVEVVSVRKRGAAGGLVHFQEEEERQFMSKSDFLADIKVYLAGMVAEEIWLGESGSGPMSDIHAATARAFQMATHLGMGSELASLLGLQSSGENDFATAMRNDGIRREIDGILQGCKDDIRVFLEEKRPAMEALRDALVARGELTGDEFRTLLWEVGAVAEPPKVLPQLPVHSGSGNGTHGNGYAPVQGRSPDQLSTGR
jgi:cell division protease FtsH